MAAFYLLSPKHGNKIKKAEASYSTLAPTLLLAGTALRSSEPGSKKLNNEQSNFWLQNGIHQQIGKHCYCSNKAASRVLVTPPAEVLLSCIHIKLSQNNISSSFLQALPTKKGLFYEV
ncbi:hypothetical protein E2C01_069111 [Portunus trituberculatus]|uniref:Uncharacterized protein n=1 Tax=Portunus trituberculatus TaxID=210409 RepID=A0A5B7HZQ8_PORTR|nr:hypothetical protein [Portunus trituberculatus]